MKTKEEWAKEITQALPADCDEEYEKKSVKIISQALESYASGYRDESERVGRDLMEMIEIKNKAEAEKSALEEREANYLKTIAQDTQTIKDLRREIGLMEEKVKGLVEALEMIASTTYLGGEVEPDVQHLIDQAKQALAAYREKKGV